MTATLTNHKEMKTAKYLYKLYGKLVDRYDKEKAKFIILKIMVKEIEAEQVRRNQNKL